MIFFFNDTATTEIYTLSLHDALPIYPDPARRVGLCQALSVEPGTPSGAPEVAAPLQLPDRKSTRLNSSHSQISYAVFCLKKKLNSAKGATLAASCNRSLRIPFPPTLA